MCSQRLTGPVGALLAGSLITDGRCEIKLEAIGLRKLVLALAAQPCSRHAVAPKQLQRKRIHLALGITTHTKSPELAARGDKIVGDSLLESNAPSFLCRGVTCCKAHESFEVFYTQQAVFASVSSGAGTQHPASALSPGCFASGTHARSLLAAGCRFSP
jgi:hypothetical protein